MTSFWVLRVFGTVRKSTLLLCVSLSYLLRVQDTFQIEQHAELLCCCSLLLALKDFSSVNSAASVVA